MDFEQGLKLISDDIQAMELENYALSTNEEVHIYVDHIPIPITDVGIINPLLWINNGMAVVDDGVQINVHVVGDDHVGDEINVEEVLHGQRWLVLKLYMVDTVTLKVVMKMKILYVFKLRRIVCRLAWTMRMSRILLM